jgi:uncharacterized protein YjbI with pentapeptide repeats
MAKDPENEAGLKEIPASEILDKIQKGEPVKYDHVITNGDLIINNLNLPKDKEKFVVSSSIRIENSLIYGIADFSNLIIKEPIIFNVTSFCNETNFNGSKFLGFADFSGARFQRSSLFMDTHFCGSLFFDDADFRFQATFWDTRFDHDAHFDRCVFQDEASFLNSRFRFTSHFVDSIFNHGNFQGSKFRDIADFSWSSFNMAEFNRVEFYGSAIFRAVKFSGWAKFTDSIFNGQVATFREAEFYLKEDQESAFRKAKNVLEKNGDREEAGYHFYREMDGKRKQKPWYIRYPEFVFIQMIFGYGIHPFRLWACWIGFVFIFAAIYSLGHGIDSTASQLKGNATLVDYIWFSIATAVTPGYAGYKPTPDFKLVAGIEAIFGTFMWAAFIATFARKYMR